MYEKFQSLLDKTNKTPYQVSKDTGISTARSIGLIHLSAGNGNPQRFKDEIRSVVDSDVNVWIAEKRAEKEFRLTPF